MSILFYKRPKYVSKSNDSLTQYARQIETTEDRQSTTIPPELSFDRVICNKCLPPCSLQDFLHYLTYVTHDAENLQFFLWMIDYTQRFYELPKAHQKLSPGWKSNSSPEAVHRNKATKSYTYFDHGKIDVYSEDISNASTQQGTHSKTNENHNQIVKSPQLSAPPAQQNASQSATQDQLDAQHQVYRAEINRIVAHYIAPGSPRQLNLSHNDRATVLRALKYTTHPSALTLVKRVLYSTLRDRSHPNFIRWSICNGNEEWTCTLRVFAIVNILIGCAIAITLTLSSYSRWWRIFAAIEWWFGIANIIASSQGLCVLLHRLHARQCHAWETKDDDDVETMLKGFDISAMHYKDTKSKWPVKMEVFGPANDFSGEPWVAHYSKKSWCRRLFEKRVSVHEEGLKIIQNRMIRQAETWALIITIPVTITFVAIPKGNCYPR
ncbi:hypothetical protein ACLMJK_000825 [Lecanora helva]